MTSSSKPEHLMTSSSKPEHLHDIQQQTRTLTAHDIQQQTITIMTTRIALLDLLFAFPEKVVD
jgi:hypothetical protein